jgi:hypothetical protein
MNTLETDVEVAADGSIRLLSPSPDWLKPGDRAHLLLVAAEGDGAKPRKQVPTATPEMISARAAALEEVRKLNPYRDIADPVEWQRQIREDVVQPGRE